MSNMAFHLYNIYSNLNDTSLIILSQHLKNSIILLIINHKLK